MTLTAEVFFSEILNTTYLKAERLCIFRKYQALNNIINATRIAFI